MAKNRPNWPTPGITQGVCFKGQAQKYPILQSVMGIRAGSEGFHTGTKQGRKVKFEEFLVAHQNANHFMSIIILTPTKY